MKKKWSACELELLKYLFIDEGLAPLEIVDLINRPHNGIIIKIQDLNLKHTPEQTFECRSRRVSGSKNPMFEKDAWSKGKTKENCEKLKESGKKISIHRINSYKNGDLIKLFGNKNPMFGKQAWNKGLTKETNEIVRYYSRNQSVIKKQAWLDLPEDVKEQRRRQWAKAGMLCGNKETSIELFVRRILEKNSIVYREQYHIGRFRVDFYVNDKVIECQGDYWHANPSLYDPKTINKTQRDNIERDINKIMMFEKIGMPYLFLWEYDIKNDPDIIENNIMEFI